MSSNVIAKAVVAQFLTEVFENRDASKLQHLVTAGFRAPADAGVDAEGLQAFTQLVGVLKTAFANPRLRIYELLAEGDRVAARYSLEAEYTGAAGASGEGKRVRVGGIAIARLEGQRIAEFVQEDRLGLLKQVGALAGELVAA